LTFVDGNKFAICPRAGETNNAAAVRQGSHRKRWASVSANDGDITLKLIMLESDSHWNHWGGIGVIEHHFGACSYYVTVPQPFLF